MNSAAHGHLHELLGGSWNSDFSDTLDNVETPPIMNVAHEIEALSKILWRTEYLTCPSDCSMETSAEDCTCTKNMNNLKDKEFVDVLFYSGVMDSLEYFDTSDHLITDFTDENGDPYTTLPGYTEEETSKMYKDIFNIMSEPGHIGTMFQSTSTNDVVFWVMHSTIDRLWHWKRLSEEDLVEDSTYDETWDPYHDCYGHNPDNIQPFMNLFGESDGDDMKDTFYSNTDLYDALHPKNEALPYMYDDFEWPHCEMIGESMKV